MLMREAHWDAVQNVLTARTLDQLRPDQKARRPRLENITGKRRRTTRHGDNPTNSDKRLIQRKNMLSSSLFNIAEARRNEALLSEVKVAA